MEFLYCSDPLNPKHVDMNYEVEEQIAHKLGFFSSLFSYEELAEFGNPSKALKSVPSSDEPRTVLYRGWMMKPEVYASFYNTLSQKGVKLINSPGEYRFCHYFPESYDVIKDKTPQSLWIPWSGNWSLEQVMENLAPFEDAPIVVKDYVKS